MQKIKVLVVDDEHYARAELTHLLSEFSMIDIVDEADSGEKAIIKSINSEPDVVFLDVEMPKMDGLETAKSLLNLKSPPLIIFATAYPQFAVEAFRVNAIDYLLKPYDEEQLIQTIDRIKRELSPKAPQGNPTSLGKLAVEAEDDIHYISPADILYICIQEKISKIVTTKGMFEVKLPLKELETRLASHSFFRIHRSYLVNLNYISRLTPWFNGAYQLELEGRDERLSVSRNYVKNLREMLEI